MGALIKIAWRNLYRQGWRTLITATAMAVGAALSIAGIAMSDGMYVDLFDALVTRQTGHVQIHHPDYPAQADLWATLDEEKILATIDALPEHDLLRAAAPRAYGFALLASKDKATGARLRGIDPEREARVSEIQDKIQTGHALRPGAHGTILLGDGLADTLDVTVGDEVIAVTQAADGSMGNDLYRVAGIYHSGNTQLDRGGALVHLSDLQALLALEGRIHEVALRAPRRQAIDALARALRRIVSEKEALVRTWREVNPMAAQMLATQDAGVWLLLILVFSVAGLGILNTMLMAVFERTRELGVMRALGMPPSKVVWLVLLETALMGALSAIIGSAGGLLLAWLLETHGLDLTSFTRGVSAMGMTFDPVLHGQLRLDRAVLVAGFVVGVSLVSSLWPALRAARTGPVVAMREDT